MNSRIRARIAGAAVLVGLGLSGLSASTVTAGPVALEARLIEAEKRSWVAWQGHDAGFFDHFLSSDHVEVGIGGPAPRASVIAGVAKGCVVKSYALDHFTVTRFDQKTALVVYRASQDTSCGGQAVPSPVWASSLFVNRDGRWVNALYVHTPIPHK